MPNGLGLILVIVDPETHAVGWCATLEQHVVVEILGNIAKRGSH